MGRKGAALVHPIRQQLVKAIGAGVWTPGTKLPSTRKMADEMDADPRDIAAAYRALAEEGLIDLRPRSGAYVSASIGKGSPPGLGTGWLTQLLVDSVAREISATELGDWIHRAVATLRLRVFVIATSRDQVAGLCAELKRLYGLDADGATAEELAANEAAPPLLRRSDFIVMTESARAEAERYAALFHLKCICVGVRRDLMTDTWKKLLHERPIYVVIGDTRFEELVMHFLTGSGAAHVHRLVVGRDDLDTIPENAAVYVTHAARESLGSRKLNGFEIPPARFLSREASQEILELIVQENLAALSGRRGN